MGTEQITWVIKLSKLCNMRCSYCYEWNELDDPTRMDPALLVKVYRAAADLHFARRRAGSCVITNLVLHGGEPLILPPAYLRTVFDCARHVFAAETLASREVHFSVQSNLLSISDEVVDLLQANRVDLGVSFDVIPGVRRTLGGASSEERVLFNMERLRARGVAMAAIAVLAKHTAPRVTDIYDFFAGRQLTMRVLPLFDGPSERPENDFAIDSESLVNALIRLFRHWIETGACIRVEPLGEWFANVLRKLLGVRRTPYDRRRDGDRVILVNTDGRAYRILDVYDPARALGDLNTLTYSELVTSRAYHASLDRDDVTMRTFCEGCAYSGTCNRWPVLASRQGGTFSGRCPSAYPVHRAMEEYLLASGYDAKTLRALLASDLEERGVLTSEARASIG
ncbi:MAG: radical SAM protein [Myxococcales bacterium]|nr:radical SAM protein [Myxococcales bacterium]